MTWNDIEEIGIELYERMPEKDPLTVRYTDLLKWIESLDDFNDDISKSNESKLEAVQMAWHEEWKENQK